MNDFDQLIKDIDAEAQAEGPAAIAQLRAFEVQFTLEADLIAPPSQPPWLKLPRSPP